MVLPRENNTLLSKSLFSCRERRRNSEQRSKLRPKKQTFDLVFRFCATRFRFTWMLPNKKAYYIINCLFSILVFIWLKIQMSLSMSYCGSYGLRLQSCRIANCKRDGDSRHGVSPKFLCSSLCVHVHHKWQIFFFFLFSFSDMLIYVCVVSSSISRLFALIKILV